MYCGIVCIGALGEYKTYMYVLRTVNCEHSIIMNMYSTMYSVL